MHKTNFKVGDTVAVWYGRKLKAQIVSPHVILPGTWNLKILSGKHVEGKNTMFLTAMEKEMAPWGQEPPKPRPLRPKKVD